MIVISKVAHEDGNERNVLESVGLLIVNDVLACGLGKREVEGPKM